MVDDALPLDADPPSTSYFSWDRRDEQGRELACSSSFFEKAFVRLACFGDYKRSRRTEPVFAFSCFSDCIAGYRSVRSGPK